MYKKTALHDRHVGLGAKLVAFAGWEMPLHYKGVIPEHLAVREHAGIFDVSHMGRISFRGTQAEEALDYLSTNKISGRPEFSATYTVWCNSDGGSIDDGIVYKVTDQHFFVIVNAANRDKDLAHFNRQTSVFDVAITDHFQDEGILAVQGPNAINKIAQIFPKASSILPMHFQELEFLKKGLFLSRTGYTGADGMEIYASHEVIVNLWDLLIKEGVQPAGLGARDTLRLEMGYALYGHELTDDIAPLESVSAWTVKLDKKRFLGRESLLELSKSKGKRLPQGAILIDQGIAREGMDVFLGEKQIGWVTSGNYSPVLKKGVALLLTNQPLQPGEQVEILIRGKKAAAVISPLPFIKKDKR